MRRFIIIRFLYSLLGLFLFSLAVFWIVRLGGDPVIPYLSPHSTREQYDLIRAELRLDEPIYVQYGIFLAKCFRGDFGDSLYTKKPVIDTIKTMLPNSFRLIAAGAFIAYILALPMGVMAAVKKDTFLDYLPRIIAALGQSIPSFWIGLIIIQIFAVELQALPTSGMGNWRAYLMPGSCLALFLIPGPLRLLRSSMLEILDSEYIKLARIKGVSEKIIVWKHALKNALLPVLSYSGIYLALMVTGCIAIETVFAWPGMGRLCYRAIITQDFPVIQGVVITTAFLVILANFLVDILYGYLDPRIRLTR